jgi:hypothetical protein
VLASICRQQPELLFVHRCAVQGLVVLSHAYLVALPLLNVFAHIIRFHLLRLGHSYGHLEEYRGQRFCIDHVMVPTSIFEQVLFKKQLESKGNSRD